MFELRSGGQLIGYLTTTVGPMRSFPAFWIKQEWLWAQPHWLDGHPQEPEEDYGPGWSLIEQLQAGAFETFDAQADEMVTYETVQKYGPDRDRLWRQYGSPDAAD